MNGRLLIWVSLVFIACGGLISAQAANVVVVNAIAQDKIYDGTTTATVNFSGAILVGISNADLGNVTLVTNGYTATFDDQYVDSGKTVTVSGLTLTGSAAGNYTLTQPVLSADIDPLPLTITATGVNKTYNGNTNASVTLSNNHLVGDSVTAYYTTAGFADKNIGTNKTVTVYGLIIAGADADSYTLTNSTVTTTANISSKVLHVAATGVNKPYDGTTNATVTLSDNHVIGDNITDTYTNASFASPFVGNGITINVSGIAVSGPDAPNYTLAANTAIAQANITPFTLTVTATGQNKTYDGTTNATVTLSDNRVSGDNITVTFSSAGFMDKYAGTNKPIAVNGLVLTGPDSDSYVLATNAIATTANISSRSLTIIASGVNKTYDGTTNASVTLSDNRIAGDSLTDNYSSASFSDKNVGSGKTVAVTGISLSGSDAMNYSLGNTTATTPANITARSLTVSATGQNKTYDGTTTATVSLSDNRMAGDSLTDTYTSASFSSSSVGSGITVNVSGIQITGSDALNYSLSATTAATTANITGRALTVAATGVNKTYDGTTAATVTLSDNRVAGDVFTVNYGSANFSTKAVGTGISITVSNLSLTGANAGNYSLATSNTTAAANITVRSLGVTATAQNKTYDATTAATVTLGDNRVAGDSITDNYAAATFSDKTVGNGKAVTVTGINISGADAGNYSLTNSTASSSANITARSLTITATGINKAYDATTNASVTLSDNRVAGDSLTDTYVSAGFASPNIGSGITVNVSGIQVTGSDSANYTLANTTASTTANITGRVLTVAATGVNKPYDGTTTATVTLSDNRVAGDTLTVSYGGASFASKNAGTGISVTVTNITLSGASAGNYSLATSNTTTSANITTRSLIITATGVNKSYDGTTNATVTLSDNRVAGDSLTDTYTSAGFASPNAGTGIAVNVMGLQVTGSDSINYALSNTTATATANITGRALTVAATGVNKVYDATTAASVTLSDNRLSGDSFTVSYGSASFSDKTVSSGKSITVSNLTLSGSSAANYYLSATNISATANITARPLAVTATGVNKTYDGTTAATVTLNDNRIGGDVFTDSYSGATFSSSAVGNGKTVSVTGIYISGTDAGNYSLTNTTATTTANILAAVSGLGFNTSVNPAGYLGTVTFTASLPSDATGTVTLLTNGVSFASGAPSSGAFAAALASLPRGTNLVTATYSGDVNYSAATNSLSEIITNHPPQTGFYTFSVTNGVSLKLPLTNLLSATFDADGDTVSLVSVSPFSTNGMPIATNTTLLLFKNTNYVNDSFSYVVTDHYGGYATGQVNVASVLAPFTGQSSSLYTGGTSNVVTFHALPYYVYTVQRSVNLLTWKSISTNTASGTGAINYVDTFADLGGPPSSAFYRLLWQPN